MMAARRARRARQALACGALAACCAVAACSVAPEYRRPATLAPPQWRDPPGDAVGDLSVWPDKSWWQAFASPELDRLVAEAERSNDDWAAAVARVREADAQARIAGAPLFPTVDFGADVTRERSTVSGVAGTTRRTFNVFNPQFTASYELDFWGKNRALRTAARAVAVASRYDQATVALTVVSSVASTYFQALAFRDRVAVAKSNSSNGKRILQGLERERSAGTATGLDVAQQETAVALLDAALPPLVQQYHQAVYALAVLVGRTPDTIDVTAGSLADLSSPPVVAGLPSELLARRPDVAAAEQQLIAANADIGAARAALFPSFALTASGGYESTMLTSLISPANRMYAISAGLTQPIFHGGALHGQVAYDQARYAELLTTYHKAVLTAFSNVDSALTAARQTAEQRELQREAVSRARRAYDFAQAQLSAGTVNILTVLNTQNALFSAEDVLVQVQYSHLQSLIDLYTALGGGWQQG